MRAVSSVSTDQAGLPDGSGDRGDGRGRTHRCAEAARTGGSLHPGAGRRSRRYHPRHSPHALAGPYARRRAPGARRRRGAAGLGQGVRGRRRSVPEGGQRRARRAEADRRPGERPQAVAPPQLLFGRLPPLHPRRLSRDHLRAAGPLQAGPGAPRTRRQRGPRQERRQDLRAGDQQPAAGPRQADAAGEGAGARQASTRPAEKTGDGRADDDDRHTEHHRHADAVYQHGHHRDAGAGNVRRRQPMPNQRGWPASGAR